MPNNPEQESVSRLKFLRLFQLGAAAIFAAEIGVVITVFRAPEWHGQLLRFLGRAWGAFVTQDVGSTSRGFFNGFLEAALSIFAVAIMTGYLRGWREFKKHLMETAIIALFAIPTVAIVVYGTQFAWEVAKAGHEDHLSLVGNVKSLHSFADQRDALNHQLRAAQSKADQWQQAYEEISKGELVPDRIMSGESVDRLHGKLVDYAKHSGARKYSTVRIAPVFWEDRESSDLALSLERVFKDSGWAATLEPKHPRDLMAVLNSSFVIGVAIYSDDPHNQATWLMWMLKDVGIDAFVADNTPPGFKGTLICVGYKQMPRRIEP